MDRLERSIFNKLFREAYRKCFEVSLEGYMSEPDSKFLSQKIFEQTGLIIGWKTLKNYSQAVMESSLRSSGNPSLSSLDTLARFVLNAPVTNEAERKESEGHYPFWYSYREKNLNISGRRGKEYRLVTTVTIVFIVFAIVLIFLRYFNNQRGGNLSFTEDFHSLEADSLSTAGWVVHSLDPVYWNRRDENEKCLTLFTLKGDNWPDSTHKPLIRDLMLKKINGNCFTAEIHYLNFIPLHNWQQAGLLLMEDSSLNSRSLRFSLTYNDYSGGATPEPAILLQAIFSSGGKSLKPEEILHDPVFFTSRDPANIIRENLAHSSLRIEKDGNRIRLLFSDGAFDNSAFKQVVARDIDFKPAYIGIFAMEGFVDSTDYMPVRINYFSINAKKCPD